MPDTGVPADWITGLATLGQSEPWQWLPVVAAYLVAVGLALAMTRLRLRWQLALCLLLVLIAVPVSEHAEARLGVKDDGRILVDEMLAFPVATLALPLWRHPWLLPGVLVTSWVLDSTKPPPVAQAQAIAGGAGIVLDDVLANLYTLALAHLVLWLYRKKRRGRQGGV